MDNQTLKFHFLGEHILLTVRPPMFVFVSYVCSLLKIILFSYLL
jgi:hypothetical protein